MRISSLFVNQPSREEHDIPFAVCQGVKSIQQKASLCSSSWNQLKHALPPQNEDQQQSQSQQQEAAHQGTEAAPSEGIGPCEVSVAVEINAASQ